MSHPQAIFFDLDGTLIDTAPDMGGALNRMLEKRQRPVVPAEVYRSSVSHGSIALLKLGFPELGAEEIKELKAEFLQTYADGVCIDSKLFDDAEQLLASIESLKIPWGIVTNKPEGLTLTLLETLELRSRCCSIIGADTTTHAKPHPAPMQLACTQTGVSSDNCFYVGDAERDIQAGRSVNMKTFIAGWGYIDARHDNTDSWQADVFLQKPLELLEYL